MKKGVIALRGDTSEKLINGKREVVTPFVGTEGEGICSKLGIGLLFQGNNSIFWGQIVPHALIQSWRGMKMLERVDLVTGEETLRSCWTVARNNIYGTTNHYMKTLSHSFSDFSLLEKSHHEILDSFPTAGELETMIILLQERNIPIDTQEIEDVVRIGRVATTPLIEEITSRNNGMFTRAVLGLGLGRA